MGRSYKDFWLPRLQIRHVLILTLVFRLIAVLFSRGYAFHDDHFEMAELVARWREGYSFLWTGTDVHVFSLVYPGFLYLVFEACIAIGINDPEQIMFVVRLIHALFSLVGVWYTYKLVLRITGEERPALVAALCMALFWIFPFMSVRNVREFVCIPFLIAGCYYIADPKLTIRNIFISAFLFALAFTIRLQVLFIPFGIGAYLLFNRATWSKAIYFGIALALSFVLTQGLFDWIYYGDPLASVKEYLRFNSDEANIMIQPRGPWYLYIGTVAGAFLGIPFLLLAYGFIKSWKLKHARMLVIGSLLFFAFHSYYSNKQERFILPFLPFFIILGVAGYYEYYKANKDKFLVSLTRFAALWFIILNTIGLFVLSFSSSKRSRVDSMVWLRKNAIVDNLLMEGIGEIARPPLFYLGKQVNFYSFSDTDSIPKLTLYIPGGPHPEPNYLIMSDDFKLNERLERVKKFYPSVTFVKEFKPGFVDNIAYWLNPKHNQNETWFVYRLR